MVSKGAISNTITMDLIYEILSRLPAKSISRFRCVSKQWMSIISSQYFKDLFHTKSSFNPSLLILLELDGQPRWFFSSPQPDSSSLMVASDVSTIFTRHTTPKDCQFCYSACNYVSGLIYFPGKAHAIWNPSMGQNAIYLPPAPQCCGMLGYDPIDKQFKVLIYKVCHSDELVYQILTIGNENERWREIKCPLTYDRPNVFDHICINGVLYYIAKKKDNDFNGKLIGCFDVRSEKFKFLYPNFIDEERYTTILINYKGKLSAIHEIYGYLGGFPFEIRMWVLEDVDEMVWKKYVYTLNRSVSTFFDEPVSYDLFVVGATTSGDIVLTKRSLRKFKLFYVLYFNPERNTLRYAEIKNVSEDQEQYFLRRDHGVHYFVDHVENLGFDFMKTAYARTEASTTSSYKKKKKVQHKVLLSEDIDIIWKR